MIKMDKKRLIDGLLMFTYIALLCFCFYNLGQESSEVEVKEKIIKVEVEVNDKGFCVACYKKHNYDEMYLLMNEILNNK